MLKYSRKEESTQSKTNLVDLFRKRIGSRSNKNTPLQPSSMRLRPPSSSNQTKQRLTPSKTSIFSIDQPSEISLKAEGYLNCAKQQLACSIHNNKLAKFSREGTEENYCEKCAIILTHQGYRLIQIDGTAKIRKISATIMQRQVQMVQETYNRLIVLFHIQMEKEIEEIKRYFNDIEVEEFTSNLRIQTFVPNMQLQKLVERAKVSIGKISYKTLNTQIVKNIEQAPQTRQSHRRCQKNYGRESEKSSRRKPQPAQIMINLYMQESRYAERDKENRETNLLA